MRGNPASDGSFFPDLAEEICFRLEILGLVCCGCFSAGASEASFREAPAADREFCSGTTGENSRTQNLLAAQKEAEVSQQTSAQTVQQTFHSHEIQLKETPFGFTFDQLLRLFGEIWLAGALFLGLVGLARYYLALHRLYRWSLPVDDEDILKDYQRAQQGSRNSRKPPKLLKK